MNIKKNVTINLSEDDVKEIIAEYCNKNGYRVTVENVILFVGNRYVGYGTNEHKECYFGGCRVNVMDEIDGF